MLANMLVQESEMFLLKPPLLLNQHFFIILPWSLLLFQCFCFVFMSLPLQKAVVGWWQWWVYTCVCMCVWEGRGGHFGHECQLHLRVCTGLSYTHLHFGLNDTLVLLQAIAAHEVSYMANDHHQGIAQVGQDGDVIGRLLKWLKEIVRLPTASLVSQVQCMVKWSIHITFNSQRLYLTHHIPYPWQVITLHHLQ